MRGLRTLPVAVAAAIALAAPAAAPAASASARETAPASKTQYLQSGQYARDVVAAAAPATAWIRKRSDQAIQLTAACKAYGLAIGADGKPGTATVREPTAEQLATAARTAAAAKRAARRANSARTAARRIAKRKGATRTAIRQAARKATALRRKARSAARTAQAAAAAAVPPSIARPTASACRGLGPLAVVFDIDETLLSNYIGVPGSDPESGSVGQFPGALSGTGTKMPGVSDAYFEARKRGMAIFLITARPVIVPGLRETTVRNLRAVGYDRWDGLSFKENPFASSATYKTAERAAIEARGYRIVANVGDQTSDIVGGHSERTFKLPNPFYTG
ncbi:HAD family acid phosphatase [Patulibacter medicamentivorans]|uniref:HAD family acid phosphatase n=1 Tax=Patulibacter medicamentivorans TaxID=1097667 RepID=UPI001110395C|nr:HAD family acid phosphatase [Patulibacter medicamentivorans]